MKVDTALLCDAAQIRDGMLFVLGGGVAWLHRPEYPAPLGATLALRIGIHQTEVSGDHTLEVLLQDADGGKLAQVTGTFTSQELPEGLDAADELFVPVVLPLGMVVIPRPGRYSFEILVDKIHQRTLPFAAKVMTQ